MSVHLCIWNMKVGGTEARGGRWLPRSWCSSSCRTLKVGPVLWWLKAFFPAEPYQQPGKVVLINMMLQNSDNALHLEKLCCFLFLCDFFLCLIYFAFILAEVLNNFVKYHIKDYFKCIANSKFVDHRHFHIPLDLAINSLFTLLYNSRILTHAHTHGALLC